MDETKSKHVEDEIEYGKYKHWNMFYFKDSIMAHTKLGTKTLLVYYTDKYYGIKCSLQVHDANRIYYAHIEDGNLLEKSFENEKQEDRLTTEDLKIYASVLYTLPEKLREAIEGLI